MAGSYLGWLVHGALVHGWRAALGELAMHYPTSERFVDKSVAQPWATPLEPAG